MTEPHDQDASTEDALMQQLAELPSGDVDVWRVERIRAGAHRVMRREADGVSRWLDRLERIYARTLEPLVVFGVGSLYVIAVIRSVIDILS